MSQEIIDYNFSVRILDNRNEMGRTAAADAGTYMRKLLAEKEEINCIFAAAPSQSEMLRYLCTEDIDWSRVNGFHMDEYIGLEPGDPRLFSSFLDDAVFKKVLFKRVNYISAAGKTREEILTNYTRLLQEYPVDITFMGIGENGHIAFNDPHVADFQDKEKIKVVDLDEKCRMQQVHDGCFDSLNDVPQYAMTLTIPSLMAASRIFCVVPASTKAQAVRDTVFGGITEACPASILRLHPNATLYTDTDAGKYLL